MLNIIRKSGQLPYGDIMYIYEESNREKGLNYYPRHDQSAQLIHAEQDLYEYLSDVLDRQLAVVALWSVNGRCVSALRLEQYRDGFLLTALETAPDMRRKGYACDLVRAVLKAFPNERIYSHIYHRNLASIALHKKCGFTCIDERAAFLDGSISAQASTYLYIQD